MIDHNNHLSSAIYRQTEQLSENNIRNQIFQIQLALSQTSDPDKQSNLLALLAIYDEELQKHKRKRAIRLTAGISVSVILLIFIYLLFLLIKSDSHIQNETNKLNETPKSEQTANLSPSVGSASSGKTQSSKTQQGIVPPNIVGTWEGNFGYDINITISEDGHITKTQHNQTYSDRITRYQEVGTNIYRLYFANDADMSTSGTLIFEGIGGTGAKYASGIYISGDTIYPQLWQAPFDRDFTYPIYKDFPLYKVDDLMEESVDTTKLSKTQLQRWVLAVHASQNNLTTDEITAYFVNVKTYDDRLAYASVRAKNEPDKRISLYRINAKGELEQGTLDATNWQVVSTTYYQ